MSSSPSRLAGRRLYIADLARRQVAMEAGRMHLNPLAYRVLSKRLRQALAGQPEPSLKSGKPALSAAQRTAIDEVLEVRHFDQHGRLRGPGAGLAAAVANELLDRLRMSAAG